jgi:hypothetical protein
MSPSLPARHRLPPRSPRWSNMGSQFIAFHAMYDTKTEWTFYFSLVSGAFLFFPLYHRAF